MFEINGKYTKAKVMIDELEPSCVAQITQMINHPAFTNPVSIMSDAHSGKGSVIGFTMEMTDKIIPNVIGVDLGCGCLGFNIGNDPCLEFDLAKIDHQIRRSVPFGFHLHDESLIDMKKDFPWHDTNTLAHKFCLSYNEKYGTNIHNEKYDINYFESLCKRIGTSPSKVSKAVASLGGGNHFCELGKDLYGDYWFTIHTGSRNLGKCICEYWQNVASKIVKNGKREDFDKRIIEIRQQYTGMDIKYKIKEAREEFGLDVNVKSELQYLEGEDAYGYLFDMLFAQKYAEFNRHHIMLSILKDLYLDVDTIKETIETTHNFIDFRDFIIRKGAIRSYKGDKMLIPFNPRDGILICEGKSNPAWNYSSPHGCGRIMSRSQANKILTDEQVNNAMEGVFASNKPKDESPLAYKSAALIESCIGETVTILNRIKPIMNMKAG